MASLLLPSATPQPSGAGPSSSCSSSAQEGLGCHGPPTRSATLGAPTAPAATAHHAACHPAADRSNAPTDQRKKRPRDAKRRRGNAPPLPPDAVTVVILDPDEDAPPTALKAPPYAASPVGDHNRVTTAAGQTDADFMFDYASGRMAVLTERHRADCLQREVEIARRNAAERDALLEQLRGAWQVAEAHFQVVLLCLQNACNHKVAAAEDEQRQAENMLQIATEELECLTLLFAEVREAARRAQLLAEERAIHLQQAETQQRESERRAAAAVREAKAAEKGQAAAKREALQLWEQVRCDARNLRAVEAAKGQQRQDLRHSRQTLQRQHDADALRSELGEAVDKLKATEQQLEESRLQSAERQCDADTLRFELGEAVAQLKETQQQLEERAGQAAEQQRDVDALRSELGDVAARLKVKEEQLEERAVQAAERQRDADTLRSELGEVAAQLKATEQQLEESRLQAAERQYDADALRSELGEAVDKLKATEQQLEESRLQSAEVQAVFEQQRDLLGQERDACQGRAAAAEQRLQEVAAQLASAESQLVELRNGFDVERAQLQHRVDGRRHSRKRWRAGWGTSPPGWRPPSAAVGRLLLTHAATRLPRHPWPHPPSPPCADAACEDPGPQRLTRRLQSQMNELKLRVEGLQFEASLLQTCQDHADLTFLYSKRFESKFAKACAGHAHSAEADWDLSNAVSIGLREDSTLVSASTVRHHPAHNFLELVAFATSKQHERQGKGRIMASVVEVYARKQGFASILVRADTRNVQFWLNPSVGYTAFEPSGNASQLRRYCAEHCLHLADTTGLRRRLQTPAPDPIKASLSRLEWKVQLHLKLTGIANQLIEVLPPM